MSRPRLLDAMVPSDASRVIAVIASPGYGKTTLMLDHVRHHPGPVLWVDVDRGDNDPVRLIAKLASGLGDVSGGRGLVRALRKPGSSAWERLIPRVGAVLAELPGWILAFDDVHEIESTESLDVLSWLALHVPEGRQLILAGRSAVGLPIPRLRNTGHLREIGPRDLAFTDSEAQALLVGAADAGESAMVNRRCEGWAAGLRMALLAGEGSSSLTVSLPTGPGRFVEEYLQSELLPRLDECDAEFLIQTSVLHRLRPGLCDAILERDGSIHVLRRLAEHNAFITVLDGEEHVYRCHELVRDALASELEARDPARSMRSRLRSADWHAAHGFADEAVRYAQESGDRRAALAMIGRHAQTVFGQGRTSTMFEWLDWVESEQLMSGDPDVALSGMIGSAISGQEERAARWADALEATAPARLSGGEAATVPGWIFLARALSSSRGPAQAVADASAATERIPASSRWRRVSLLALGLALLVDDQEAAAGRVLVEVTDASEEIPPAPNAEAAALDLRASLALREGDVTAARTLLAAADRVRETGALTEQGPQAFHDALVALVSLADGEISVARERIAHAQRLRPLLTWAIPGLAVAARCELARAYLASADPAGARTLLLEVNDILRRRPRMGRLVREAEQLRLQLGVARGMVGSSTLTAAELRILPLLATHFGFKEIGERLLVSSNTVKTHAHSIYRKLDATSRSEAVANGVRAGILDPASVVLVLRTIDDDLIRSG